MYAPTDDEMLVLRAQHAHRTPNVAKFHVTGDDDEDVTLTLLLGNPSGACKMPLGAEVSPAWDAMVAATFRMRPDTDAETATLVADSVLWPDAAKWGEWSARWPALPDTVSVALRQKTGARLAMIEEPKRETPRPDAVKPALVANPGSVWRRLKPGKRVFDVVIAPPDAALWQMFTDAMKKRDSKSGTTLLELAQASVKAAFDETGAPVAVDAILGPWPGQVLLVGLTISALAGARSDFELGE